jgi:hypothetical protein
MKDINYSANSIWTYTWSAWAKPLDEHPRTYPRASHTRGSWVGAFNRLI